MDFKQAFCVVCNRMTNVINSYPILWVAKRIFVLFLAIMCLSSIAYYLDLYLKDGKTIITTAKFYGEHHQHPTSKTLMLPRFTICFSKVFTYGRLSVSDIKSIYGTEGLQYNSTTLNHEFKHYKWKTKIEDVIKQVKFQSKVDHPHDVFEPVFYLPSVSCWRTKEDYNVYAYRAGRVNTLDLVINAAVYDDIMVNYESPMVHMFIIPFVEKSNQATVTVGDLGNAIAISPGTYSSVGFQVTKINSRFRNRNDARLCDDSGKTQDTCRANHNKQVVQQTCELDDVDAPSNASHFYACGVRPKQTDITNCYVEPCLREIYAFTKSEGYIKFDKRLSVLNMSTNQLTIIAENLANAMQLDSQYNPWRLKSFVNLASGIDFVTNDISSILQRPTGFKCAAMNNLSEKFVMQKNAELPNVVLEQSIVTILNYQFTKRCNNILRYIFMSLMKYGFKAPCFQHMIVGKSLHLLKNAQADVKTQHMYYRHYVHRYNMNLNHENDFGHNLTIVDIQSELRTYGNAINKIVTSLTSLRTFSMEMANVFKKLNFTKFIETFSAFHSRNDYTRMINEVLRKLHMVSVNMFEGIHARSGVFSRDDVQYRLEPHSLRKCSVYLKKSSSCRSPKTFRQIWAARNWMKRYESTHSEDILPYAYTDVFIPGSRRVKTIPTFIDLVRGFYVAGLGVAERIFNSEISYSLGGISSRFTMSPDYVLYVIGSILTTYDTANLFYTGSEGLNGAERSSCFNLMGRTSQANHRSDVEFASPDPDLSNKNPLKLIDTAGRLLRFLADYSRSLVSYNETASRFTKYYKQHISAEFEQLLTDVMKLRGEILYHQQLVTRNTRHKVFLIGRMNTFSSLVRDALAGSGEHNISKFLSRKGTILVGEIRIEMAELDSEHANNKAIYKHSNAIIHSILMKRGGNGTTITDSIFAAIMSSVIHPDDNQQRYIIRVLKWCNDEKWMQSKAKYGLAVRIFSIWLRNVTALVQRAKRYANALVLSRAFMRRNMMKVSLYYDSLQVLTKTSQREFSIGQLYASCANVASIYLKLTLLNILEWLVIVMCLGAGIGMKFTRFFRNRCVHKTRVVPISKSPNITQSVSVTGE